MILNGVIGAPWQVFSNKCPFVTVPAYSLKYFWWAWTMIASSSSVHRSLLIHGLRWLCQRSRHCFPIRPGSCFAMYDQFLGPLSRTNLSTFSSYSLVCLLSWVPRGLSPAQGWAPSATCVGTVHLCVPANMMQSFSNCEPRAPKQALQGVHPPRASTSVFAGEW